MWRHLCWTGLDLELGRWGEEGQVEEVLRPAGATLEHDTESAFDKRVKEIEEEMLQDAAIFGILLAGNAFFGTQCILTSKEDLVQCEEGGVDAGHLPADEWGNTRDPRLAGDGSSASPPPTPAVMEADSTVTSPQAHTPYEEDKEDYDLDEVCPAL